MSTNAAFTRYRPNFCAECGAKLLRLHWHVWTSRRFCNECARHLRKTRLAATVAVVITLVSLGFMAGRARRSSPPPLIIQRRADSPLSDGAPNLQSGSTNSGGKSSTAPGAGEPAIEDIYTCGARTKKGTPCSRRVHGPVRCWQHKGMRAMLPQEKLLIRE